MKKYTLFFFLFVMLLLPSSAEAVLLLQQSDDSTELESIGGVEGIVGATSTLISSYPAGATTVYARFTVQSDCIATSTCLNGDTQFILRNANTGASCAHYTFTDVDKQQILGNYANFSVPLTFQNNCSGITQIQGEFYQIGNTFFPTRGHTKANVNGEIYLTLATNPAEVNYAPSVTSNLQTDTRFVDLAITGTSTVTLTPEYFIASNEVNTEDARFNPSHVRFTKSLRPASSTDVDSVSITPWVLDDYATTSLDLTGLSDGVYDVLITFGNLSSVLTGVLPFANAYIYSEFTVTGGILTATGTVEIYNGYTSNSSEFEYLYQECGITALSGCLNNSLIFLFQPNQEFLNDSYERLNEAKRTNAPFSHIEDLKSIYAYLNQEFQGSSTPPEVHLTFMGDSDVYIFSSSTFAMIDDDIHDSFRALQIAFLWIALGFAIWATRYQLTL